MMAPIAVAYDGATATTESEEMEDAMEGEETTGFLETLSRTIEARWEDAGEDRKMYFQGLNALQDGRIEEAARVFRRARRQLEEPFSTMAKMALGRCEVVRGHQGVALGLFRKVAESSAPEGLRKMAWMEVADLARSRDDDELLEMARSKLDATVDLAETAK